MNAASCRASIVRHGHPAFSVSERTILPPSRLPSYIERASKCVRVLPSRRVEMAHARTHARTHSRYAHVVVSFIKSRVSRGNACARALTTGTDGFARFFLAYTYLAPREDVNTRLRNERSAPTSARFGCAASEDAPLESNKSATLTRERELTLSLFFPPAV